MSYVWVDSRVQISTESEMTPVALVHTHVHTYMRTYVCMCVVLLLPTGAAAWPYIEARTALCLTEVAV